MTGPQHSSPQLPTVGRLLVAVSGPDDSGKTTLVGQVVDTLRQKGCSVTRTYCYGCVMCRRFPGRPRSGRPASPSAQGGTWFDALHARIDASETALRLAGARGRAAVRRLALRRPCVILTDRGPLDSLAKFDPPPGSRTAALFRRLAGAYDLTLLLESHAGEKPADDAADGNDPGRHWQERYRRWARSWSDLVGLDARGTTPALAADAAFRLMAEHGKTSGEQRPRAGTSDGSSARRRVVVSAFDTVQNTDYRGGGSVVIDHVARRLAQEFDVTVVTAGPHGGTQVRDGLRYHFVPVCRAGPRAAQLLFQAVLPLVARRIPHDVWLENFTPPFATGLLPLLSRKPVIGINQCRCGEAIWRKYHIPVFPIEHRALRRYRDLVVLNQADAADARRHSPRAAVHLIENGVDQRHVEEDEFGSGGSILFLGRLDVQIKGLDLLLAAYAAAAPALPLYIAGQGPAAEERRVESLLARTGGDVRRLGFVASERKERVLRESAFMVMPSRTETFGLVALESMAHGKPVLHFDLPSLDWMEGKGNVGVPCFDVDRMAEEIGRLAADADLRRALGRQAHRAARHYTWEAMAERYADTVRTVLDSSGAVRSSGRRR
ncbi:glycosyltransferase [Streptomyces sp. NPDC101209]|uniref:glycosyltransferase n=1 Tax=Streptomyces sp. NPDC101209 TaxID=3366129 RepID=UPI00381DBBED